MDEKKNKNSGEVAIIGGVLCLIVVAAAFIITTLTGSTDEDFTLLFFLLLCFAVPLIILGIALNDSVKEIIWNKKCLAIIGGVLCFIAGTCVIIPLSVSMMDGTIPPIESGPAVIPCIGFFLMIWGGAGLAMVSYFIGLVIYYKPKAAVQYLKEYDEWQMAKQIYFGMIGIFIVGGLLVWWLCVSIVPWFILFGPGLIIATFTGRRK